MIDTGGTKKYPDEARLARLLFKAGAACPFLREPIEKMEHIPDGRVRRIATDGLDLYCSEAELIPEDIQHLLMHCLFRHMLPPEKAVRSLWDLACDMSAEYLRTDFFPDKEAKVTRLLIEDSLPDGTDPRLAPAVYRALMDLFEEDLEPLYALFERDDHRYWYLPPLPFGECDAAASGRAAYRLSRTQEDIPQKADASFRKDRDVSYRERLEALLTGRWPVEDDVPAGRVKTNRYGLAPGSREEKMLLRKEGKYDFSRYLRRFSTTREEMVLDLGGFDNIPYYYGLQRYGNMPLIEPLEYSEKCKVEELVIAIDTSGSCSRPVVERFLAEIERILMQRDFFFRKMNVRIIQCDAIIQSHTAIRSYEEWKQYVKDLTIRGRGGTDFTPVFRLVEKLIKEGKLKNLKGLLYFTDGDGVYPVKETPYETAFVFTTRRALDFKIPDWITPLCLDM